MTSAWVDAKCQTDKCLANRFDYTPELVDYCNLDEKIRRVFRFIQPETTYGARGNIGNPHDGRTDFGKYSVEITDLCSCGTETNSKQELHLTESGAVSNPIKQEKT